MKILYVVKDLDFYNPLGLAQIAAMSKQRGDQNYLAVLSKEDIFKKIDEIKPDVIAYSGCTGEHKAYVELNKKIKSNPRFKNIFTIMGGPHATFFREVLDEAELDAICIGEGELAFVELLEKLEKGKNISEIKNIIVKGGKLKGLRPLIQDLDSLPFPDMELFYNKDDKITVMNFMLSRGCPYNCTYCFNHAFRKMYPGEKYIRRRSVNSIIKEILEAKKKFNFRFVRFVDDAFVLREDEHFREFCERYPKEVGLPLYIFTRFDVMTPNIAKLLKKAGCTTIFMSIETVNKNIREKILKRPMDDISIINGARYCRENGITVVAYTMLGLPSSTIKDDIAAVDFSIKAGIDIPEFPIYQPLPKTELAEMCKTEKLIDKEGDLESYSFTSHSVLNSFTEKEKNIQRNIAVLGPTVVRHPLIRNLVMEHLIYLPHNIIFSKIYAIDKVITYPKKVFPMKYTFKERFDILKKALKVEKARRPNNN